MVSMFQTSYMYIKTSHTSQNGKSQHSFGITSKLQGVEAKAKASGLWGLELS